MKKIVIRENIQRIIDAPPKFNPEAMAINVYKYVTRIIVRKLNEDNDVYLDIEYREPK